MVAQHDQAGSSVEPVMRPDPFSPFSASGPPCFHWAMAALPERSTPASTRTWQVEVRLSSAPTTPWVRAKSWRSFMQSASVRTSSVCQVLYLCPSESWQFPAPMKDTEARGFTFSCMISAARVPCAAAKSPVSQMSKTQSACIRWSDTCAHACSACALKSGDWQSSTLFAMLRSVRGLDLWIFASEARRPRISESWKRFSDSATASRPSPMGVFQDGTTAEKSSFASPLKLPQYPL
mmetsp:Transcript_23732/g.62544  ORF Transcript_23732/g.62544 Transcript_23732/m.62544 type:complete len:236 (+) Transcript_23732:233-940(+)